MNCLQENVTAAGKRILLHNLVVVGDHVTIFGVVNWA